MIIRVLTILTAIAAVAGPAAAKDITVNIVGKDAATVRAEVTKAAQTLCREGLAGSVASSAYASCVDMVAADALVSYDTARVGYGKAVTPLDVTLVSASK